MSIYLSTIFKNEDVGFEAFHGDLNWSIITESLVADTSDGYMVDTTDGTVVITLPNFAGIGDFIGIKDYASTFDTYNLTIHHDTEKINGSISDWVIDYSGFSTVLVYAGTEQGWLPTTSNITTEAQAHIRNISSNPHNTTKEHVGLGNVDNTADVDKPVPTSVQTSLDGKADEVHTHVKIEVGLGNVDNTTDMNKPVSTDTQSALNNKSDITHDHDSDYEPKNVNIQTHISSNTNPHSVTKSQVGLGNVNNTSDNNKPVSDATQTALNLKQDAAEKGQPNGIASLDGSGLVPSAQLPTYVDDVLEYASLLSFPNTGDSGKIYVALDTNKTYRWGGSTYTQITSGAVDTVDGQDGVVDLSSSYEPKNTNIQGHISSNTNPHGVTKSQVGLSEVNNTTDADKPVSTAVQTALNGKSDTHSHPYALNDHNHSTTYEPKNTNIQSHISSQGNVHNMGKVDIGLGNVQDVDQTNASNLLIGTLPDYVLPERIKSVCQTITDWNDADQNGWFMGSGALKSPIQSGWVMGQVISHNTSWLTQTVHAFTTDGVLNSMRYRRDKNNGVWGAWEQLLDGVTELDARYTGAPTKAEIDALNVDADTLDGIDSTSFLRSNAADTASGQITFSAGLKSDYITNISGDTLALYAGESVTNVAPNISGEVVVVGAEAGLSVYSSTDNWATGWTGVNTATINNASGDSYFPGNINATGRLESEGGLTTNYDSTDAIRMNKSSDTVYTGMTFDVADKNNWLLYTLNDGSGDLALQSRNYIVDGAFKATIWSVDWSTGVQNFTLAPTVGNIPVDVSTTGDNNFAGSGAEVTIAHGLGVIPSFVSAVPTADPAGYLGEVWVRKDATNIYVGNSGSHSGTFNWIATK